MLGLESAKVDLEEFENEKGSIPFRFVVRFGELSTEYESNFTSVSWSRDRLLSKSF